MLRIANTVNEDGELEFVSEENLTLREVMPAGANIVKLYYHHDRLGSIDYLTDNVAGKVISYVSYDDWGAMTAKAVLKTGVRELDLVSQYTVHPFDQVLGVYFAQARMYDAADRRFMAVDPVDGTEKEPVTLLPYIYVENNPHKFCDPLGLWTNNIHYNMTFAWAKDAGFNNDDDQYTIAYACNDVDSWYKTKNPVVNWSWHFNTSGAALNSEGDTRRQHYNQEKMAAEKLIADAIKRIQDNDYERYEYATTWHKGAKRTIKIDLKNAISSMRKSALVHFGTGLHPLQDIYAHRDWNVINDGGVHFAYYAINYYKKTGCLGQGYYYTSADGDTKVFDDPTYNVKRVTRNVVLTSRERRTQMMVKSVFEATAGDTRYNDTRNETIKVLTAFYSEVKKLDDEIAKIK